MNASALSAGNAEVELRVKTKYPAPYESKLFLSTIIKVKVINKLTTDIPSYIQKPPSHPSLLIIPPNTLYQIKPYGDSERVNKLIIIFNLSLILR